MEDFARRLNSVWPERMQEILSLGQDRRLVPVSLNGNGALKKSTGKKRPFSILPFSRAGYIYNEGGEQPLVITYLCCTFPSIRCRQEVMTI